MKPRKSSLQYILLGLLLLLLGFAAGWWLHWRWPGRFPLYCHPNLTVVRSDTFQDGQAIPPNAQDFTLLGFRVTNRHSSVSYALDQFSFYAGIGNQVNPSNVRNVKLLMGATQIAIYPDLATAASTPNSPIIIPPLSSQQYTIRADIFGPSTSSTLRAALGNIEAEDVTNGVPELVVKESNFHLLRPPSSPFDESVESARWRY